jgi:hypothetical protein
MSDFSSVVVRTEVPVLYVRAEGGPAGAPQAFARLEAALGGPRGRRFYGWFHRGEYRACAVRLAGDDASALGLSEGTLDGGRYARARHEGPAPRIHETFLALLGAHGTDETRADLEEYRRADEVYALHPIPA